jgi:ribonuclease HI
MTTFFDGACRPFNPGGVATWGIAVYDNDILVHEECGLACAPFSSAATKNYAEYTGHLKAMEYCLSRRIAELVVKVDSPLVITQMTADGEGRERDF